MRVWLAGLATAAVVGGLAAAQGKLAPPPPEHAAAAQRFASTCAGCHGATAMGGGGPSLMGPLKHGVAEADLAASIRHGYPDKGMPAFGSTLSEPQIGQMAAFLRDARAAAAAGGIEQLLGKLPGPPNQGLPTGVVRSDAADFTVEKVAQVRAPFGMAFLPDGRILISEAGGALRIVTKGRASAATVQDAPAAEGSHDFFRRWYMDVSVHPDARRGWVYLIVAGVKQRPDAGHVTTMELHRGRIRGDRWTDDQLVLAYDTDTTGSSRLAWDAKGFLYTATGDGHLDEKVAPETSPAQRLDTSLGKILRMTDDGKVPPDNPYVGRPGAYPYIWSLGHRTPTGLAVDARGQVWEAENGPRGGDEINLLRAGRNYGWPITTWGHLYEDRMELARPEAPGMEQPVAIFVPSPALSGLAVYEGQAFPRWRGNLFAGSMKAGTLYRIVVNGDREVLREVLLHNIGRIRDVDAGPDGLLYVLLDSGALIRLKPAPARK